MDLAIKSKKSKNKRGKSSGIGSLWNPLIWNPNNPGIPGTVTAENCIDATNENCAAINKIIPSYTKTLYFPNDAICVEGNNEKCQQKNNFEPIWSSQNKCIPCIESDPDRPISSEKYKKCIPDCKKLGVDLYNPIKDKCVTETSDCDDVFPETKGNNIYINNNKDKGCFLISNKCKELNPNRPLWSNEHKKCIPDCKKFGANNVYNPIKDKCVTETSDCDDVFPETKGNNIYINNNKDKGCFFTSNKCTVFNKKLYRYKNDPPTCCRNPESGRQLCSIHTRKNYSDGNFASQLLTNDLYVLNFQTLEPGLSLESERAIRNQCKNDKNCSTNYYCKVNTNKTKCDSIPNSIYVNNVCIDVKPDSRCNNSTKQIYNKEKKICEDVIGDKRCFNNPIYKYYEDACISLDDLTENECTAARGLEYKNNTCYPSSKFWCYYY